MVQTKSAREVRQYWPYATEPDAGFPSAAEPNEPILFTAVRDPIKTAFDAYLEIGRKTKFALQEQAALRDEKLYLDFLRAHPASKTAFVNFTRSCGERCQPTPEPEWRLAPCRTSQEARQRFAMYLDALQARENCGKLGYHAYPQAMKINVVTRGSPRYDAIVKLDALIEGLTQVATLAGVTSAVTVPRPKTWEAHSNDNLACANFELDEWLTRRLCKIYQVLLHRTLHVSTLPSRRAVLCAGSGAGSHAEQVHPGIQE